MESKPCQLKSLEEEIQETTDLVGRHFCGGRGAGIVSAFSVAAEDQTGRYRTHFMRLNRIELAQHVLIERIANVVSNPI